jgi:hypothetical protein
MQETRVEREVSAPADAVWAIATDPDRWVEVVEGIDKVERLDGSTDFAVGFRWRETRTMFGKEATEEMEITALEPGRRYDTVAESHGSRYRSAVIVDDLGAGRSRLAMTFSAEPLSTMTKLLAVPMGWMMTKSVRKALEKDLADIATAAEASAT